MSVLGEDDDLEVQTGKKRIRPVFLAALCTLLLLLCCGGGAVAFFLDAARNTQNYDAGCGNGELVDAAAKMPNHHELSEEQVRNAAIIVRVGQDMNVPPRGWVIAVATAMQESSLHNLPNLGARNDHDSLGLFQQRPSTGWGTPAQVMDPEYASRKFYERLLTVPGWMRMSLTRAAQRVQRSAFPDAYAKHEQLASTVVNSLTGGAARAVGDSTKLQCVSGDQIAASGWTAPVNGEIGSGFRTASRPTHQGIDLMVPRGTPIRAAAGGLVVKVRCQAHLTNGTDWGCWRDGSPSVRGCGWYVEIQHANGFLTRYCHMVKQPSVVVGQRVAPGQEIGFSGTTGNSSGPHLHFEVHINSDPSNNGAIDAVPFMQRMGAPLGVKP
ncbi:M23 family metallopeptidase [Dactylosporangium sp. NPDC051484]|uniref:M23 family metallopeptidase n=1 Tax=Dactylosporangium sp. NPDC051484 TaxID=3154942 RepID=UPI00344C5B6F